MSYRGFILSGLLCLLALPGFSVINPHLFTTGQGPGVSFRSFEDDSGGFFIVWTEAGAGKTSSLRAQHLGPTGESLWDPSGLLITSDLVSQEDWGGLADSRGGISLFWNEADGVRAQRFKPDGTRMRPGNSVLMSSSSAIEPDAVPDAAGGTLIVWRQELVAGRSVIMVQRLDVDGQRVWPQGGVRVSLRASHQINPRVVYDNMSGMIVAWRDEANLASELRVQRIDFQGNRLWGLEGLKITSPMGLSEFPRMAPTGNGEVLLAWNASVQQISQIFLQKVGPEARLKWSEMKLASNNNVPYNRWNPSLVGDDRGGAWISWEDFRDQTNYQLQLNHLDGQGRSVWAKGEMAVAPAPGDQGKMVMCGDGKEGVWLAWIDNRLSTVSLYLQEVDPQGKRLQGPQGRRMSDTLVKPSNPQLISLSSGKAAVIWADRPKKGQWQLFWTML